MAEEEVQAIVQDINLTTGQVTAKTGDGRSLSFNINEVQLVDMNPKELVAGKTIGVRHTYRGAVATISRWSK